MSNALLQLSASVLREAADIRSKIEKLEAELGKILSGAAAAAPSKPAAAASPKRTMSPAARARIAAGQRARWAKIKAARKGK